MNGFIRRRFHTQDVHSTRRHFCTPSSFAQSAFTDLFYTQNSSAQGLKREFNQGLKREPKGLRDFLCVDVQVYMYRRTFLVVLEVELLRDTFGKYHGNITRDAQHCATLLASSLSCFRAMLFECLSLPEPCRSLPVRHQVALHPLVSTSGFVLFARRKTSRDPRRKEGSQEGTRRSAVI